MECLIFNQLFYNQDDQSFVKPLFRNPILLSPKNGPFIAPRNILVLDEVTANLDRKTEDVIIQNIAKLKTKMTILVSTHSTSFDKIADQILELGESPIYSIKTISHKS